MDAATFRQHFPEFADTTVYPTGTIDFYLGIGRSLLNADRWGETLDYGLELFTAHHLAIVAKDRAAAAGGGAPGAMQGVLTSKTVDKVSASYDSASISLENGGFWNMTSYGLRFLRLARMMGAGGYQL